MRFVTSQQTGLSGPKSIVPTVTLATGPKPKHAQTSHQTDHMTKPCPFCNLIQDQIIDQNEQVMVIRDGFPVSEGHTLIIPHRHVGSYFDTTSAERKSIEGMLLKHRKLLANELGVSDFNIGINDGPLAGQTVPHLHVHLIPRREGDMQDPRGGVRYVIPEKAKYW